MCPHGVNIILTSIHPFLFNNLLIPILQFLSPSFSFNYTKNSQKGFGVSLDKYPRLQAWMKRCHDIMPEYEEVNQKGVDMLVQFFLGKFPEGIKGLH